MASDKRSGEPRLFDKSNWQKTGENLPSPMFSCDREVLPAPAGSERPPAVSGASAALTPDNAAATSEVRSGV